jgi:hypothetical protein
MRVGVFIPHSVSPIIGEKEDAPGTGKVARSIE